MINLLYIYDLTFFALFTLFVILFLYKRRKKLQREGIIYVYRTKIGIKFIDYVAKKFKRQFRWLQYVIVVTGYILMLIMLYLLGQMVYLYFKFPEVIKAVKVPPIMPLIPYLPEIFKVDFLPPLYFTYWIIVIAIVATVHEFSHGFLSKFHGIKIKSTGFGFLGPVLAAFVEPDEKKLSKKKKISQISVLSAGSFANLITFIIFLLIFILFFELAYVSAGAIFNVYSFSEIDISSINTINNKAFFNPSAETILENLNTEGNLTKIKAGNESYIIERNLFLEQEKTLNETNNIIYVYDDLPAVNAGLEGPVIEFNGQKIKNNDELSSEILKYKPGDEVEIKTKIEKEIKTYNVVLAENPAVKGKPYLGIGIIKQERKGILGKLYSVISFFKDPATYYEPRINFGLAVFIENLLWWIIVANISLALFNMLPLGVFDGGRVFYLTALAIFKSEKKAEKAFRFITYFILLIGLLMMLFWFYAMFLI